MQDDTMMSDSIEHGGTKINSMMGSTAGTARSSTAQALDKTAKRVHSGADELSRLGHETGRKLDSSARYLREHSTREMVDDMNSMVRAHPGRSLVAALAVRVLLGRALRS